MPQVPEAEVPMNSDPKNPSEVYFTQLMQSSYACPESSSSISQNQNE
jgi:hypothetical protein